VSASTVNGRASGGSHQIGILHSRLCIELQSVHATPSGEVIRVDVHADDSVPLCLLALAAAFGSGQPFVIVLGQIVPILKHRSQVREVFPLIPDHAYNNGVHAGVPEETVSLGHESTVGFRPGKKRRTCALLTAGVDVQRDRIEIEVMEWASAATTAQRGATP